MIQKIFSVIILLLSMIVTKGQSIYKFEGKDILPGTQQNFIIPISTGKDSTFIPITVFNGVRRGKTFGITAGVHGYEYAPILAAQKLNSSIDPKKLIGVIILVNIANVESFRGRSPYFSPIDNKNLNRSFPGSSEGSNTEKIADFITNKIIRKADYFLDMHSGDAPEDLFPYGAYYSNSKMPAISKEGKKMAIALGFDNVVNFNTDGKKYMNASELSLYCSAEAFKRGIPSIDIECGRLGLVEETANLKVEQCVLSMLTSMNFIDNWVNRTDKKQHMIINERTSLSSKKSGIFYPLKKAGDHIEKGTQVGYITNHFGETIEEIVAPDSGIILMILSTPPINVNDDIIVIGKI
jgi:predicted deacylase